jgi:hypothetical protein
MANNLTAIYEPTIKTMYDLLASHNPLGFHALLRGQLLEQFRYTEHECISCRSIVVTVIGGNIFNTQGSINICCWVYGLLNGVANHALAISGSFCVINSKWHFVPWQQTHKTQFRTNHVTTQQ